MKYHAPKIMGVLNVTPDSFSDGGQHFSISKAVKRGLAMSAQGADILDIGGESTRPRAKVVGEGEELSRVIPVIQALRRESVSAEISIDTRRPNVAKAAIDAGANIWNDITALNFDAGSISTAAKLDCKVVLMHMQGTPPTMQDSPEYADVMGEVWAYLKSRTELAIMGGVKPHNIIIDPGIGFGKRLEDNLDILQKFDDLYTLGFPVLIGASRKSFIGKIDDSKTDNRLGGSIACALWAVSLGASIVRVHDVKETTQALKIWQAIRKQEHG